MEPDIGIKNQSIYGRARTARWYASLDGLTVAEQAAFARTRSAWEGGDVLDIGIGGGRTCRHLADGARSYVGVDFSPAMVAASRERHPDLDIRPGDARDLSGLPDGGFDFAFFADNGIDAVDDADRMKVLAAARRVLRPGGVFLFNTHNRDCRDNRRYWRDMLRVRLEPNPIASLKSVARVPIRFGNYLKSRGARRVTERYAIMADPGNDFASPHYYATATETARQIAASGLLLEGMLDISGQDVPVGPETSSATLYFVTRKPAAS